MLEARLAAEGGDFRSPGADESAGYEAVRDSWVDAQHPPEIVRSEPPALPTSIREAPGERTGPDAQLADLMFARVAGGDDAGALMVAEALLRRRPTDADALDCAEMARSELRKVYVSRLGALEGVPRIAMTAADIAGLTLDVFAGFVLSRIDGVSTLRDIAFSPGMSSDRALQVLSELYLQGVIAVET